MAKFTVKSEYFTTPLKLILPGLIVATAGYFLFNNPEKKKAKETYQNWNVIREYEDAFIKGNEDAICSSDTLDQIKFRKDYTHLLEILINNLTDLKNDGNVDKRLDAFLNIKIARYTEAKKMTESYLDSVLEINKIAIQLNAEGRVEEFNNIKKMADDKLRTYIVELGHVETRDTAELRRISVQLNKEHLRYTDSFTVNNNPFQSLDEVSKNLIGKWWFPEILEMLEFNNDQTGIWQVGGLKYDFKWSRNDYVISLSIEKDTNQILVPKASANTISIYWKERNLPQLGCRKSKLTVADLFKRKK
jgi:hypothetical protein